jgi:hypothetical protein
MEGKALVGTDPAIAIPRSLGFVMSGWLWLDLGEPRLRGVLPRRA